jgi:type IV pilus assembly protein PilN
MRITLNLATRPFADLGPAIKRLRIGMGVLAGVAIGLGIGLHSIHQKAEAARARDHSLDGQIGRINQEREGYQALMRQPDNAQLLLQAGYLNRLFDEKAFSWTLAMEDLETVLPGGVQVATLEPVRAKDGHITLHLRVLGPRDRADDMVRNLEHSRRFLDPRIVGENAAEAAAGPNQQHLAPVSASDRFDFELLADYNPAGPEERKAMRKAKPSGEAAESKATPRPLHPVPMPLAGQGRPAYPGPANPGRANPGPAQPQNPNPFNRSPLNRPPNRAPGQPGAPPQVAPDGQGGPQ